MKCQTFRLGTLYCTSTAAFESTFQTEKLKEGGLLTDCYYCKTLIWNCRWPLASTAALPLWPPLCYETILVQGDPNQNLLIQMAITLKICISDPMLLKPKCVLKACIYFWKLWTKDWKLNINVGLWNTFCLY